VSAEPISAELDLVIGAPAHGGSCVAHAPDGRVVFVRHALPGERVRARITAEHAKYLQADAIEVLEPSPDRVDAPCEYAHPGGCGGCDLQHVAVPAQRDWKAGIVHEQLARLAGLDIDVLVEALPDVDPERPGLGWRTRVGYAVDRAGRAGLHPYRSRTVLPIDACLLAHPGLAKVDVLHRKFAGGSGVDASVDTGGGIRLSVKRQRGPGHTEGPKAMRQKAVGHTFSVRGFWQVHPAAADTLSQAVLDAVQVQPGDRAVDLYAGAGLFAAALADAGATVIAVEGDRRAAEDAVANLQGLTAEVWHGPVEESLADPELGSVDVVVLDPPRTGAGREIVERIALLRPRAVAYVACDPAALARDVAYFATHGYVLGGLRAFDCFPMTHHVECVALLEPAAS
jgi:tRNA/tmRNA/rRNA uracil-C5-methylase (TrmA/RlmC/RlmD family)